MSHYATVQTVFRDQAALIKALEDLGFKGKIEVHAEAQNLYGYQGDMRDQKAHIILRRKHVGSASNDIGFVREADGSFRALISEFDGREGAYDKPWVGKLSQRYAYHVTVGQATAKGYRVVSTKEKDGRLLLELEV